jgi:TetR/AcrR family transcriptional regulator, transcriptional repressor for nem operon
MLPPYRRAAILPVVENEQEWGERVQITMRYASTHKERTHQRIIDVAGRLFKERGIDATGVALVMSEAELTNGAFYAHFASKEALVEAVISDQLRLQLERFQEAPDDLSGLEAIAREYLSPEHRDSCGSGCPSAALLDELVRRSEPTRQVYSDGLVCIIDTLHKRVPLRSPEEARSLVLALLGLLIGTLQVARAVTDRNLSNSALESGLAAALSLMSSPGRDARPGRVVNEA